MNLLKIATLLAAGMMVGCMASGPPLTAREASDAGPALSVQRLCTIHLAVDAHVRRARSLTASQMGRRVSRRTNAAANPARSF